MKNILRLFFLINLLFAGITARAQQPDTSFYLVTCGPGIEVYSHYGHSALLVSIGGRDTIYNWGVFDYDTPNFAWKFAKGRLNYMLGTDRYNRFLRDYFYEQRYVFSQKMNVTSSEKRKMMDLIAINLRPENVRYRYDFFYDDCSTRIRDLLENSVGGNLKYPSEKSEGLPTFRDMINKYQVQYPWLQFGIDLLVGSPAEQKANLRDRMFLPDELMSSLSSAVVNRNGQDVALLDSPSAVLDFDPPVIKHSFIFSPMFIFSALFVLVAFLSFLLKSRAYTNFMDFILFFILALLALIMIFFNFFTDHAQTHWNLNILWLNPFMIICFLIVLLNREGKIWFNIVFYISLAFLLSNFFIPQSFNTADYPVILIILLRSFMRSDFKWNPFRTNLSFAGTQPS